MKTNIQLKDDDLVDAIVNNKKIEYTEENNFPVTQTMDEIEKKKEEIEYLETSLKLHLKDFKTI